MKRLSYLFFALILLLVSWKGQSEQPMPVAQQPIPEDAIRLRIIANSDSPQDQWLKREVRDEVTAKIERWVREIDDREEARKVIQAHLGELQQVVDDTIKGHGFSYSGTVELGTVPFPTKMYGPYVYPAGEYEALRITLGEGLGENWWCVLFPPLCFVDLANGDAVQEDPQADAGSDEGADDGSPRKMDGADEGEQTSADGRKKVEVKFYLLVLWDKIKSVFAV
ncbi:hypothetical protein BSNK01_17170 [Bacillaceae bacterium]